MQQRPLVDSGATRGMATLAHHASALARAAPPPEPAVLPTACSGAALDDICMPVQHLHDLALLEVPLTFQPHTHVLVLRDLGYVARPLRHVDHLLYVRAHRAVVAI